MANEEVLGPRKTMLVLVIVVGCFAVLWPRLLSPLLLGRDHLKPNQFDRDAVKQERPIRGASPHPALRERGRAIPPASGVPTPPSRGPVPLPPHARPPPIPGMRPPLGSPGGPVPAPKSSMSFVMPIYTICIIVFFVYTLSKILFKRTGSPYEAMAPDPQFRRRVFRDDSRSSPDTKFGHKERDARDEELEQLRARLAETERAMQRIVSQLGKREADVQDELGRPYTNGSVLLNNAPVRIVTSEYKEDSPDNIRTHKEPTPEPIKKPKEPSPEPISELKDVTFDQKDMSPDSEVFVQNDLIPEVKEDITEPNEKNLERADAIPKSKELTQEPEVTITKSQEPTSESEELTLVQKERSLDVKDNKSETNEFTPESNEPTSEPKELIQEPKILTPEPENLTPKPKEELILELDESKLKDSTSHQKDSISDAESSSAKPEEHILIPKEEITEPKEEIKEPKERVTESPQRQKEDSILEAEDLQVSEDNVEIEEPKKVLDESLQRLKSSLGEELQKLTSELSELTEETKKANDLMEASLDFISNEKEHIEVVSTEELQEKVPTLSPEKKQSTPELLAEALKESPEKEEVSEEEYTEEEVEEEEEEEPEPEKSTLKVLGMTVSAHSADGSAWPAAQPPVQPRPPPQRQEPEEVKEIYLEGEIPQQGRVLVADFDGIADKNKDRHSPLVVSGKMTLSLIQDSPRNTPEREPESTVDDFTTASAVSQPAHEKKEEMSDEEEEVVLEESEEEVEVEEIEEEEDEEEEEIKPQNKGIPKTK